MASLSELRDIENQRIEDERAAVQAAEAARIAARDAEERAKAAAEAARIREEHEAKLAIEKARLDAEREARMKIEAAEAAERTRQQAMLAEQRLAQELELRRAEIARKRPTWMLAVTAIATLAAFVLIYVAVEHKRASERAETARAAAEAQKREMRHQLDELGVTMAAIESEAAMLDERTVKLQAQVKAADTAAKAAEAQAELDRIAQRKRDNDRKRRDAAKRKWDLERADGVKVPEKCKGNVLC